MMMCFDMSQHMRHVMLCHGPWIVHTMAPLRGIRQPWQRASQGHREQPSPAKNPPVTRRKEKPQAGILPPTASSVNMGCKSSRTFEAVCAVCAVAVACADACVGAWDVEVDSIVSDVVTGLCEAEAGPWWLSEGLGDIDGILYSGFTVWSRLLFDGDAGWAAYVEDEEEDDEEEEEEGGEGGATFRNLLSRGDTKRWISSPDIIVGTTYNQLVSRR